MPRVRRVHTMIFGGGGVRGLLAHAAAVAQLVDDGRLNLMALNEVRGTSIGAVAALFMAARIHPTHVLRIMTPDLVRI